MIQQILKWMRLRLRRKKKKRYALMQEELKRFLVDNVLRSYKAAMANNPNKDERLNTRVDLPMIRFQEVKVCVDMALSTRNVHGDISYTAYCDLTPPVFRDKCILRFLQIKEAYEATFSNDVLEEIKNCEDFSVPDWSFKQPWLTCYRFHFKKRIGDWLHVHRDKWDNTFKKRSYSPRCDCH